MADERDGAGDEPHRHRHEERVVGQQLARVVVYRSRRDTKELDPAHPRQQQAGRNRDTEAPEQRPLQRLGPVLDRNPKSKSDAKKCRVSTISGRSRTGQAPAIVSTICLARGANSGCSGRPHERLLQRSGPSRVEVGHAPLERDPPR